LKELIAIAGNKLNPNYDMQLLEYLTEKNILTIEQEIVKLKESLAESRELNQEEYCMALLTEFYREKYPNHSDDTLLLMASSHYIRVQKEYHLQESRRKLLEERAQ